MKTNTRVGPTTISELTENYFNEIEEEILSEDDKWIHWVNKEFRKYSEDGNLNIEKFKKALGHKKSFFAERFFTIFDTNSDGQIECGELINGLRMLKNGNATQKLKFLFDVFDVDGSGTICIFDLKTVLKSGMEESSLSLCNEDVEDLTKVLFEEADADNSGEITFDEFQSSLEKHPGLIEELTFSATHWFEIPQSRTISRCSRYCSKVYFQHNTSKIVFIFLYILANLGFGAYAAWYNHESNGFLITARICGMLLNFNCTLIMIPMLRHTLNLLRATKLRRFFPLDENVNFHKWIGGVIATLTCIHITGHIGNAVWIYYYENKAPVWQILFTDYMDLGLFDGTAYITGWIIATILLVMTIFALPCVRSRIYQVFFTVHFLCIPFWILLLFHCQHFWMWMVLPGTIFIIEQIYRIKWIKQLRYGITYIEKVTLLPCGVTHIEISRPKSFEFKPGDYVFIQIPDISPFEFHPFTISSAPELKDRIWLHVRTTGNWTNQLHQYLAKYDPGEESDLVEVVAPMLTTLEKKRKEMHNMGRRKSIMDHLNGIVGAVLRRHSTVEELHKQELAKQKRIQSKAKNVQIRCFLDGPYGTASREALNTEHAILIGAGIGVTPMASILHSILHRLRKSKRLCPECTHCWYDEAPDNIAKMKKVDFVWINRDQRCFEWFVHVLNNLEIEQSLASNKQDKLVDFHLYMSAAVKKHHMEGVGLQLALELVHRNEQKDFFTGLKTKTQPGRPDWDKLFSQIALQNKGKKKVFFCGPVAMGDAIKQACERHSLPFAKENF